MFIQTILDRCNGSSLLYVVLETIPRANRGWKERMSKEVGVSSEILCMV